MKRKYLVLVMLFFFSACSGQINNQKIEDSKSTAIISPIPFVKSTNTPFPSTPTPQATSTPLLLNTLCMPIDKFDLNDLKAITTQPFKMPRLGFEDGHVGIDFSFYRYKGIIGIEGLPIDAVLTGQVISVLSNQYPYGNALIIETPIDKIPQDWLIQLQPPALSPTVTPNSKLNCPIVNSDKNLSLDPTNRSLYVLYAHMKQSSSLKIGDQVECGQQIGLVGNSGDSTDPHLHLETRIGPSGAIFQNMEHYDNRATNEEMHNYCIWRVTNLFELFDPMKLLNIK